MTSCNHCSGFTRSQLLRQGAAQAGNGIRAIEPGMPIPAGTGLTRRSLITHGATGALLAFANGVLPAVMANWQKGPYRAMRQNALRMLILTSSDFQTS